MKKIVRHSISILVLYIIVYSSHAKEFQDTSFYAEQIYGGANYNITSWYVSYFINAKTSSIPVKPPKNEPLLANKSVSYPNPFQTTSTIEFSNEKTIAKIQVANAAGIVVLKTEAIGSFTFGDNLAAGIYFVTIEFPNKIEYLKVVKE